MPSRIPTLFIASLLVLAQISCVSVPEQVRLIDMDHERGQLQLASNCIQGAASNIKVSQESRALDSRKIALLNWNVYKGNRDNWSRDFNQLVQLQDIAVLQEALLEPGLQNTLQKHGLNWSLNHSFNYDDAETGVLTASRVKAKRVCGLRAIEPLIRTPKTILISEYHLTNSNQTLLVANIHGINFTLGTESYKQQINSLSDAVKRHKGPVIVAGDFNTWSDDRMDIVQTMANQLSLQAVTYKTHNRITVLGNPLDHVFYRGLEVISEKSIEVESSDHNPIMVTFKLPLPEEKSLKI